MKQNTKILLIQAGHASEPVRSQFGDMNEHFARALPGCLLEVYPICDLGDAHSWPDLYKFDRIIMSGSAAMVGDDLPWIKAGRELIREILERDIPFLGVCFGHQLLAQVCGAEVGPNPRGRTQGTGVFTKTTDDSFFSDLPTSCHVQLSHRDVVLRPSSNMQILGHAPHDPFHAFKLGKNTYGVQFHPEWDRNISSAYITARRPILVGDLGEAKIVQLESNLANSPEASQLLLRFAGMRMENGTTRQNGRWDPSVR